MDNKKIIYLEADDDITDIISKIENASEPAVFLVPPKSSAVLKSVVNIKLLQRAATNAKKKLSIVSSDPTIVRLAALSGIMITDQPSNSPSIPDLKTTNEPEAIVDEAEASDLEKTVEADNPVVNSPESEEEVINSIDLKEEEAENEETSKDEKKKKSLIPNFAKARAWIISLAVILLAGAGFLTWAIAFAPKAEITVSIRTTSENFSKFFSDNINLVLDPAKESVDTGVFLMEKKELTKTTSVVFEATGEKNVGTKATGTLTFSRIANNLSVPVSAANKAEITIAAGTQFTFDGKKYQTTEKAVLRALEDSDFSYDAGGADLKVAVTADAKIEALLPGEAYNIADSKPTGWTPGNAKYSIKSSVIAGGTDKMVRVVSESDITKAKESLTSSSEAEGRDELYASFDDSVMPIKDSLQLAHKDPVSTPALGEEVKEGTEATLASETVFTMHAVARNKIERFIKVIVTEGIKDEIGRHVYSTGIDDAFIERFTFDAADKNKATAKLKTSTIKIGPSITADEILEKSLGQKVGKLQALLASINGVSSVKVETSFFWVTSIPTDVNRVTVNLETEK